MKTMLVLMLSLSLLAGCKSMEPATNDHDASAVAAPPAIMVVDGETEPAPIPALALIMTDVGAQVVSYRDAVSIEESKVTDGKNLQLTIAFGGGCESHDIVVFGQVHADGKPGIDIYLSHNAHDDRCEAWLSRSYSIDLAGQITQFQQSLGHGEMQVRIFAPQSAKADATVQVPF